MWVQRTPEEVAKWKAVTQKQARSDALQIGIGAWIGAALVLSAGWVASFRTGVAVQGSFGGTFLTRLPVFALLTAPIAFIAFRYENRKKLNGVEARTICPKCDTASEGNTGAACGCGGSFVPQSAMKWIEELEHEHTA
jgi:hypothetical protein